MLRNVREFSKISVRLNRVCTQTSCSSCQPSRALIATARQAMRFGASIILATISKAPPATPSSCSVTRVAKPHLSMRQTSKSLALKTIISRATQAHQQTINRPALVFYRPTLNSLPRDVTSPTSNCQTETIRAVSEFQTQSINFPRVLAKLMKPE